MVMPVRLRIRARLLDLFHILSEGWVFPALISFLDSCIIMGSSFTILPPNSFVHISVFVHLCEAFLGIEPHFDLFRHLFHRKPQPSSASVGVYHQACSGILLAVRFVGRDRLLWNSMVQETQRFRQVWPASCVIPYVLCGGLYCLRC